MQSVPVPARDDRSGVRVDGAVAHVADPVSGALTG
jgi:hypothetical protein